MKNIYVLPTTKPSRLFTNRYGEYKLHTTLSTMPLDSIGSNQNIYTTSDEVPKDGEWCIFGESGLTQYCSDYSKKMYRKITLTTDKDLIKDGIQAIDDEFLEWFAKNPSCEKVEVDKEYNEERIIEGKDIGDYSYKVIIPVEITIIDFEAGAKGQSERMYSEKDIVNALHSVELKHNKDYTKIYEGMKEWFEQFKKK